MTFLTNEVFDKWGFWQMRFLTNDDLLPLTYIYKNKIMICKNIFNMLYERDKETKIIK